LSYLTIKRTVTVAMKLPTTSENCRHLLHGYTLLVLFATDQLLRAFRNQAVELSFKNLKTFLKTHFRFLVFNFIILFNLN